MTKYITRAEWNQQWKVRFKRFRSVHPEKSPEWARAKAYAAMLQAWGRRPPGMAETLIRLGKDIILAGGVEDMDFSWTKNAWKGIRGALGVALSAGVVVGITTLLGFVDEAQELTDLGLPAIFVPITVGVLASFRNYLKVKKGWKL